MSYTCLSTCNPNLKSKCYDEPCLNLKKTIKYIVIGSVVGLSVKWIPSRRLDMTEILIISLIASATFMALDIYSPSITIKEKIIK